MSTPEPGEKDPGPTFSANTWLPLFCMAPMVLMALLSVVALGLLIWQKATGR